MAGMERRRALVLPNRRILISRRRLLTGAAALAASFAVPRSAYATEFNVAAAPFNAPTNGTSDATAAINACISAASTQTNNNLRNLVTFSPTTGNSVQYLCNGNITFDPYRVQLDLQGCVLGFPNTGTGMIVAQASEANYNGVALNALQNGSLIGSGNETDTAQSMLSVQCAGLTICRLVVANAGRGIDCGFANTFAIRVEDCGMFQCGSGYSMQGTPTNSGENMQILGGQITACGSGVNWNNANGGLWVSQVAIDACSNAVFANGGPVRLRDCHIETAAVNNLANTYQLMAWTGPFSEVILNDCEMVYTSVNAAPSAIYSIAPAPFGVKLNRTRWGGSWAGATNNMSVNAGGSVQVSGSAQQGGGIVYQPLIDNSNTANSDPNFTAGTGLLVDLWTITKDTVANDGPLVGTNGSISLGSVNPHTGAQALAAAKLGASSTAFAFGILIPIKALDNASVNAWYRASANSLGTVALNVKFVTQQGQMQSAPVRGVPIFSKVTTALTTSLTPTTTYQNNVIAPFNSPAPLWTTHVLVEFDMTGMAGGTFYVGAPFEVYQL